MERTYMQKSDLHKQPQTLQQTSILVSTTTIIDPCWLACMLIYTFSFSPERAYSLSLLHVCTYSRSFSCIWHPPLILGWLWPQNLLLTKFVQWCKSTSRKATIGTSTNRIAQSSHFGSILGPMLIPFHIHSLPKTCKMGTKMRLAENQNVSTLRPLSQKSYQNEISRTSSTQTVIVGKLLAGCWESNFKATPDYVVVFQNDPALASARLRRRVTLKGGKTVHPWRMKLMSAELDL